MCMLPAPVWGARVGLMFVNIGEEGACNNYQHTTTVYIACKMRTRNSLHGKEAVHKLKHPDGPPEIFFVFAVSIFGC